MQLYFALGRPGLQRTFAIIRLIIGAILIYPAIIWFGLSGAAFTIFFSMFVLTIFQIGWTKKLINLNILNFMQSLLTGLYLSLIVIVPSIGIKMFIKTTDVVELILGLMLCLVAWTIAFNEIISELFDINLLSVTKNRFKKLGSRINGY
jgi:hypothetical protein